jgi:hypothetical protein
MLACAQRIDTHFVHLYGLDCTSEVPTCGGDEQSEWSERQSSYLHLVGGSDGRRSGNRSRGALEVGVGAVEEGLATTSTRVVMHVVLRQKQTAALQRRRRILDVEAETNHVLTL